MEIFLICLIALFLGLYFFSGFLLKHGLRLLLSLLGIKMPDDPQAFQQRAQGAGSRQPGSNGRQQSSAQQSGGTNAAANGKIFQKDESEYVEFEDVP